MAGGSEIRKEWLEKDYYKSLGVSKKADAAAIKKAYRKLARELHPDANPDNRKAEERFKEVSEAYDVLGDATTRAQYDEARELYGSGRPRMPFGGGRGPSRGAPGGGQGGFSQADLNDLFGQGGGQGVGFGDIFGGLFNRGGQQRAPQSQRGADVESEVTLSFLDALHGVTLPLRLQSEETCPSCGGVGARPGTSPKQCPNCQGNGSTVRNQGGFAFSEPCQQCHGRGVIIEDPCPTCHGTGHALTTRTVNARIPAGVKDGQRIRLKGKGAAGEGGGPAGDLFILIHVSAHPVFGRDGANVTLDLPVAFDEAALGANVRVPTPDGSTVLIQIPPGTANGRTFRVKGKGVQQTNKPAGDLLATVVIAVPPTLTDEAATAVQALRTARGQYDPRAEMMSKLNS